MAHQGLTEGGLLGVPSTCLGSVGAPQNLFDKIDLGVVSFKAVKATTDFYLILLFSPL